MDKGIIKNADLSREADILKSIGHPIRLKIIACLSEREHCVKDIWELMDLPQPIISQHLSILKNRGIVSAKRSGNRINYKVSDPFISKISDVIAAAI